MPFLFSSRLGQHGAEVGHIFLQIRRTLYIVTGIVTLFFVEMIIMAFYADYFTNIVFSKVFQGLDVLNEANYIPIVVFAALALASFVSSCFFSPTLMLLPSSSFLPSLYPANTGISNLPLRKREARLPQKRSRPKKTRDHRSQSQSCNCNSGPPRVKWRSSCSLSPSRSNVAEA